MADERVLRLFPTPVIVAPVADAEAINAELENAIRKKMAADEGVTKSNVGGWHSRTDLFGWAGEAAERVVRAAIALANAHTATAQGGPAAPHWRVAGWANVSRAGDSNVVHTHGAAYWSVVYYVRVADSNRGHLLLHDPRMPALRMHAPMLAFKEFGPEGIARIKAAEGHIVLFPSWLFHSVEPWDGEDERISIALNLTAPLPPPRPPASAAKPKQQAKKGQEKAK
jgi:uncharacterized protein (TIGR02466 family)